MFKIKNAAAGFVLSIVLAVTGCAATAPAGEPAQSDLQDDAGQKSTVQEAAVQETVVQENSGQENAGEESTAQAEAQDDVFDFEEGDQSAPAADIAVGSMPGSNSKLVLFKLKGRVEEWDTNPEFTWTSSDTGIFTVETADPEEGVMQITGISPGTAYLTIASEEMGTRVIGVTVQ